MRKKKFEDPCEEGCDSVFEKRSLKYRALNVTQQYKNWPENILSKTRVFIITEVEEWCPRSLWFLGFDSVIVLSKSFDLYFEVSAKIKSS